MVERGELEHVRIGNMIRIIVHEPARLRDTRR
jgi:hypothetical protein